MGEVCKEKAQLNLYGDKFRNDWKKPASLPVVDFP